MFPLSPHVLFLYLINFSLIGILPRIFFKKGGRLHWKWWLTAVPFILSPLFLLSSFFGIILPITGYYVETWSSLYAIMSFPLWIGLSVGSIFLIAFTLGTHRAPVSLWHQEKDTPGQIVTYGAYARIRHPFYAAFLLTLLGAFLFCPHLGTLFCFVYGFLIMNTTAAREERRLLASEFGSEYAAYMKRSGRFWPRLKGGSG